MMMKFCMGWAVVDNYCRSCRHVTRDLVGEVLMIAQVMSREGDNYRGQYCVRG